MVVIGAPMLITGEVGPLMNFNNFFMCVKTQLRDALRRYMPVTRRLHACHMPVKFR